MKGGSKRELTKPRDFQRDPLVIFGEPLAKGCFGGCGGSVGGGGAWSDVFIFVFVFVSDRVAGK